MNHHPAAVYVLVIVGSRIILKVEPRLPVALFLLENTMDTRLISVPQARWKEVFLPKLVTDKFNRMVPPQGLEVVADADIDDVIRDKWKRARLLAEGYNHLLWYANDALTTNWSTSTIDVDDLPFITNAMEREQYANAYATAKGMEPEQALKNLEFDLENIRTLALRRKEIIWTYETSLLQVQDDDGLQNWKDMVRRDTVDIGAV